MVVAPVVYSGADLSLYWARKAQVGAYSIFRYAPFSAYWPVLFADVAAQFDRVSLCGSGLAYRGDGAAAVWARRPRNFEPGH